MFTNLAKTQPDWHNPINQNFRLAEDKLSLFADFSFSAAENVYIATIRNIPANVSGNLPHTLPDLFTITGRMPSDYAEGAAFRVGSVDFTPRDAWFESGSMISIYFDRLEQSCFFSNGYRGLAESKTALQMTNHLYQGRNLTVEYASEIAPLGGSWSWIQSRIQVENFTGINVGDYIPVEIDGNIFNMEIAGINTYADYGRTAERVPSHIDFISRELWPSTILWNLVNYNNGLASMTTPFLASNVNAFLNSLQTDVPNGTAASPATISVDYRSSGILNQIPTEVRNVIIPKESSMGRRFSTSILLEDDNAVDWRTMGDLWLPTEIEVHGCRQWGGNLSPNQGFSSGGSIQYPIFTSSLKRVKNVVGTTATRGTWWLASANGGDAFRGTAIGSTGIATRYGTGTGNHRVPICFRVA